MRAARTRRCADASHRRQASLEATLQAQHRRCDELASAHAALCSQLKAGGASAPDADKLRCDAGELGRLLRQARLAESELKQARAPCRAASRTAPR